MVKYVLVALVSIFSFQLNAQNASLTQKDLNGSTSIDLNDKWEFVPSTGNYDPGTSKPEELDKFAMGIYKSSWGNGNSFQVKVPQMLNRISWWLPNVSMEYEEEEKERIEALPFDTENLKAGWYIKTIDLTGIESINNEFYANFEGVATISRIYINGNYVGGHLGMFGAFETRLTPHLIPGKLNKLMVYAERGIKVEDGDEVVSIAVTVPVTKDMLSSLNSGLFGGFGNGPRAKFLGIWQPVHLEISEKGGKIDDVFFNPSMEGHEITFSIQNPGKSTIRGFWGYSIKDKETGEVLIQEEFDETEEVTSKEIETFKISKEGLDPKLWTPDTPHLYKLEAYWKNKQGKVEDVYSCQVGYRTVEARGKQVYLNGKPYWIRGANMPPYGYKSNDTVLARNFLKLMHEGNTVVTRTHGNPWNHLWYTAADEIGIGVSSEGVRPWALMTKAPPPPDAILEHWKQEQLESIKEYRNHPSILFYEISNEGLQGDHENEEKLQIFKELIDEVRLMDPSRLVFQTSGDPDHNDNADLEDVHSYWGWYESSSFVNNYTKPRRGLTLGHDKPFINEECAVPYSMIDDGSVHPSYIGRYSAQSWVGDIGTLGEDHSYFQDHIYLEAKMKSEKLRYSRKELPTGGFMLFSNLTWIQHALTRPPEEWKPFPVYYGVKQGFQPILTAMETPQRFFFENAQVSTNIYIVNDDIQFKDLGETTLQFSIEDPNGKELVQIRKSLNKIPYFKVEKIPFEFNIPHMPPSEEDFSFNLKLLNTKNEVISQNNYDVKITQMKATSSGLENLEIIALGCAEKTNEFLSAATKLKSTMELNSKADVIILGPNAKKYKLKELKSHLKKGGRLILLEQGEQAHDYVPEIVAIPKDLSPGDQPAIKDFMYDSGDAEDKAIEYATGEFVEMLGWDQNLPIFEGLGAMDWKWWMTGNTEPAYVASASHKIDIENPDVIPLGRFLNSHFYWTGNLKKVYKNKIGYPVFAVNYNWGQILVCDLVINEAIGFDPRAAKTLTNLIVKPISK
jgi:hypothetical protein